MVGVGMMYAVLKIAHVMLGCLLIATMIGVVAPVVYGTRFYPTDWQKRTLKRSLFLSLFAVIPLVMLQMMLGSSIIAVQSYSPSLLWVRWSFVSFLGFLFFWSVSVYSLSSWRSARGRALRSNCMESLSSYYYRWLAAVIASTICLCVMVFMMANRVGG